MIFLPLRDLPSHLHQDPSEPITISGLLYMKKSDEKKVQIISLQNTYRWLDVLLHYFPAFLSPHKYNMQP